MVKTTIAILRKTTKLNTMFVVMLVVRSAIVTFISVNQNMLAIFMYLRSTWLYKMIA